MRRRDLLLRMAARRGEPAASLEIARRYFVGDDSFSKNIKLGLAYLQQELLKESTAAVELVGELVPLETLLVQGERGVLERAAARGLRAAMAKLGFWQVLSACDRADGIRWLTRAGVLVDGHPCARAFVPSDLATLLTAQGIEKLLDARELLCFGVERALACQHLDDARFCLLALLGLDHSARMPARLNALVFALTRLAASSGGPLGLPASIVETSLRAVGEEGDIEAQYALGCACLGLAYGKLAPQELAPSKDVRRGRAILLRAADAGRADAWLRLYEAAASCRGPVSDKEMTRFFLEKAAAADIVEAQRTLGALLLKEAGSLEKAERAVRWLSQAAARGDPESRDLLETLVLPLPPLPPATERAIIEQVRAVDEELAARMLVARVYHLTRREAMNFNPKRDLRPWGIAVPGTYTENPKGRLAPSLRDERADDLQRAVALIEARPWSPSLPRRMARIQREIFASVGVADEEFFAAEIGRSWSHYGFGRHWAARVGRTFAANPVEETY